MFRNKSASSHDFRYDPARDIPRSSFRMQKALKTTFDAGLLIPCFCEEVLPGDTWKLRMTAFARLANSRCFRLWITCILKLSFSSFLIVWFGRIGVSSWVNRLILPILFRIMFLWMRLPLVAIRRCLLPITSVFLVLVKLVLVRRCFRRLCRFVVIT